MLVQPKTGYSSVSRIILLRDFDPTNNVQLNINTQQESSLEDNVRVRYQDYNIQVDFYLQILVGKLSPSISLIDYLRSLVRLLEVYYKVLQDNGSIAKHLSQSLFISKLKSRVCELFSTLFLYIEGRNNLEERHAGRISQLDIVKEKILAERFTRTAIPRIYSCRISTIVVRIPVDRDLASSDMISKLLCSQPDLQDVETEQIARSYLAIDLISLYTRLLRGKDYTSSFLISLTNKYSHGVY